MSNDENELDPVERVVAMIVGLSGETYARVVEQLSPPNAYSEFQSLEKALEVAGLDREDAKMLTGFSVSAADAIESGEADEALPVSIARRVSRSVDTNEATAISRTSAIVSSPAIRLVARARNARARRTNIVLDSAIETDVRPLFETRYGEQPAVEVVSHSLRFTATSDLRHPGNETVHEFTLDHEDLVTLIAHAQSALAAQDAIHTRARAVGTAVSLEYVAGEGGLDDD